jgi:hypothetical protein
MKNKKVFHAQLSKTGRTYPVTLHFTHYNDNHTLAVQLVEASAPWCPFATITVNLQSPLQDKTHSYVDTNNCPWAEEFLLNNGIAKKIEGANMISGFCSYPIYEFDLESQWVEN